LVQQFLESLSLEERSLIMVPGPTNVPDRVMRAMARPMIDHRGSEFRTMYKGIVENLRYLFQTERDVFILTASGTGGVECAISNTVNPRDKVVVPVFGLFSERLKEKIIRRGGEAVELSLDWGTAPKAEQIRRIVEREKDVRAIAIVYNETSTGVTVRDLQEIGNVAKDNDSLLMVDAVSILGGDQLPVDKWNVDICVTGSQKCLACPPGLALISVSDKAWQTIEKTSRPFYFDLVEMKKFDQKYETPFTPAVPLVFALDEALKMLREETLEKRFDRHRICSEAFYNAIEALNLLPLPNSEDRSHTVIALRKPPNVDNIEVRRIMKQRYKVVIAGGAGKLRDEIFRIGCMGIVSEAEVMQTLSALEGGLMELGFPLRAGAGIEAAQRRFSS